VPFISTTSVPCKRHSNIYFNFIYIPSAFFSKPIAEGKMTTIPTTHNPNLSGDRLLAWLNRAKPDDAGLQNLTVIETFRSEKYNLLSPQPNDFRNTISSNASTTLNVSVSKANRIYHCKIAQMTTDGNFPILPDGEWIIGSKRQSSIFVRQAYKDHWELISHHCMVEKSMERVIISGTPGCGKSVEGIFFINRIF